MARPRKSEGRDTRREILDAALDLFAVGGYFGTSIRQIAREVGVRESALYHHFASKEAILGQLLVENGPGKAQALAAIDVELTVKQLGVKGMLHALIERMIDIWATPREQKVLRIILSEGPRLGTAGILHPAQVLGRARGFLARIFSELVRLKQIRKLNPEAAALGFMGPMMLLRLTYLVLPGGPPDIRSLKREAEAHLQLFMQAIE